MMNETAEAAVRGAAPGESQKSYDFIRTPDGCGRRTSRRGNLSLIEFVGRVAVCAVSSLRDKKS